ncbi:GGDEF domain-containing protein [Dokdonella sp.]|uniref:GGDEF domain-containing protein n=1 Tax=Dokdonella sp. TaxID=2291710 RepID=UPI0025C5A2D0|nr:GGDEF domain-containing protein [Dokdonella sp.]MBX3691238.1 GGDEF domain-containing protein [Dokdonella sp.]MCW5567615.1 GGDEF domain-containing protein [Dokdonella sp.]
MQEEVKVSGTAIVGVASTGVLAGAVLMRGFVVPGENSSVCLTVRSRDGVYFSRSGFEVPGGLPAGATGIVLSLDRTKHQALRQGYHADDGAAVGTAGGFWHIGRRGRGRGGRLGAGDMRSMVFFLLFALSSALADDAIDAVVGTPVDARVAACTAIEETDPSRAIALADRVLGETPAPEGALRAEALSCRGWAHAALNQRDDAQRDAHELRALVPALEVAADRVRLLRRAGVVLHRSGDRLGAVDCYASALGDAEAHGLEAERIPILVNLGVMYSEAEESERARASYQQALVLMARLGEYQHEAATRFNLGLMLNEQRQHAEAIPHLRRALQLASETSGSSAARQAIKAKIGLVRALQMTGDVAGAQRLADEILALDPGEVDAGMRQQIRMLEAERRELAGDIRGALDLWESIDTGVLNELSQWNVMLEKANLLEQLGRYPEAIAMLRRAATMREAQLRNQNHERLAALESHLRDREQRMELQRLQVETRERERDMHASQRMTIALAGLTVMLFITGLAVLLGQRRMNRRLYQASRTDPLTSLANRRAMAEHLRRLSQEATATALLLVDIDHFKRINDEYGHDIGDEILVIFGERLRGRAGPGSLVARWGGEEFLVVLPDTDVDTACAVADRLRDALARPVDTERGSIVARASIGIANLPLPGMHGMDAWHASLQLADNALYLAKRSGRDARVCYWIDKEVPEWPGERLAAEPTLARSLGLITPLASRPLRDPLVAVGG